MKYYDKISPTQPLLGDLYSGDGPIEIKICDAVSRYSGVGTIDPSQLITPGHVGLEEMSSPPNVAAIIKFIVQSHGYKSICEIGTFIGKTTMELVDMAGPGGHVTTIECGHEFSEIAQTNFRKLGYDDRVTLHTGDAVDILDTFMDESFDLIFIDGGKQVYHRMAEAALRLVKPNGTIIVDDIFFNGDIFNVPPTTDKGIGCVKTLELFRRQPGLSMVVLPESNGMLLAYGF